MTIKKKLLVFRKLPVFGGIKVEYLNNDLNNCYTNSNRKIYGNPNEFVLRRNKLNDEKKFCL